MLVVALLLYIHSVVFWGFFCSQYFLTWDLSPYDCLTLPSMHSPFVPVFRPDWSAVELLVEGQLLAALALCDYTHIGTR